MSTRREDKSSDKQRFSSDDADARPGDSSPDERTAEPEAFRAPPKVAPKFAREYVGTESPAARLMRLAQGLAGKRSEQAKKPAADDQRSAPPPHSAPPKFNPKFAKEFIGTPPPPSQQASSSTPPPPPKPPNTPPPFDPRFSSEYVGNRSPFAAKGKAAGPTAPPPPPPPPAPSVPPPKVDAKYAKETIVRPSPFTAAGASAKPAPKPSKPASAQARPAATAATGAKPPPPPRQAPPPRPPAASVPPPKVEAKYAKESVGTPSPFTTGGASAKPAPKPSKSAGAQTRPVAKAAAGPKPAAAKPAAAASTASSQQAKTKSSSNWRESKSSRRDFDVPIGQSITLEQFVSELFAGLEKPSAVLLVDRYISTQERSLQQFVRELQRQSPRVRVTIWTRIKEQNAASLSLRIVGNPAISVRGYSKIPGMGKLHARHLVVAHRDGWRVWRLDNSVLGLMQEPVPGLFRVNGDIAATEKPVEKLPRIAFLETDYESALL